MKISIIDKKDMTIRVENSTIKFEDFKLPFRLCDTLIISSNIKLNSKDLIKISDSGIAIIFIDHFTYKSSILISTNPKNADLKQKQYEALAKRVEIAKDIVSKKIERHILNLKANGINMDIDPYFEKLNKCENLQSILGIEGAFSREYFKHFFTLLPKRFHNFKRTKRPPLDPANALLSYFYTILYEIISIKLLSFGFDPSISYLHTPFRNHKALSSDIVELFRDRINQFVKTIIDNEIITLQDFRKKGGVYLRFDGRKKLYQPLKDLWESIESQINSEISTLRAML